MDLVLVESPTKAKMLSRFLGEGFKVESTMGHIRDLPQKQFGVVFTKNGNAFDIEPQYEISENKKDRVGMLKKIADGTPSIILATDPDREGEAIAWHVAALLGGEHSTFQRVVFHQITKDAILEAMEHPRQIDMRLVDAQQARRVLDRVVGYKLSPLLWKKVRRGLSAGRVQSVAVRMIVEKEKEIEAFVAKEYWEVYVDVSKVSEVSKVSKATEMLEEFTVKLVEVDGKKVDFSKQDQVDPVVDDLRTAKYFVKDLEKKELNRSPFPPFTTSTLQQAASRIMRWSGKKTMSLAQQLYEHGFITYHRTDSLNVASEAIDNVRKIINQRFGTSYLSDKPRFYKTKSLLAQEAHEAIRATDVANIDHLSEMETTVGKMGHDAVRLYQLIWKRFVGSQMADQIYDQTTILVGAEGQQNYLLKAQGQIEKFDGWRKVFEKGNSSVSNTSSTSNTGNTSNMSNTSEEREQQLPGVDKGEVLRMIKIDPQQKFTQPPARFTEAMLIKALETYGIGRPSTYAPIISTIQDRGYVQKIDGRFKPSSIGVVVNDFLVEHFPKIVDYDFTKGMEDDLDNIANGVKKWQDVIGLFWEPFEKLLANVEEKAERKKIPVEETGEACPDCKQGMQVIRTGRFGRFLSCSRFPACKWTGKLIEKIGMKCPDCKDGDVILKKTRKGKQFYGCSNYPNCKWASWRKPKTNEHQPTGGAGKTESNVQ